MVIEVQNARIDSMHKDSEYVEECRRSLKLIDRLLAQGVQRNLQQNILIVKQTMRLYFASATLVRYIRTVG